MPLPEGAPAATLLSALAQHVLFMHQQVPMVYTEMLREAEDTLAAAAAAAAAGRTAPMRPAGPERKGMKLLPATEPLLAQLPAAVAAAAAAAHEAHRSREDACSTETLASSESASGPLLAALLLGSSVASPRVVYLVRLAPSLCNPPDDDASADVTGGSRAGTAATRRLIRAVAMQCSSIATVDPGVCRLHLLLRAPRHAALPPEHFKPRPGLVVKLQRAHVALIAAATAGESSGGASSSQEWAEVSNAQWGVSGLKLPPPRLSHRERKQQQPQPQQPSQPQRPLQLQHEQPQPQHGAPLAVGVSLDPIAQVRARGSRQEALLAPLAEDGTMEIWWQSTALIRGFRLPIAR